MTRTTKLLVSGSLLRTTGLLLNVLVAFFLMPFVIRSLGDRWYGIWVIIGSFMGYYGLLDFGISSATSRFIAMHIGKNEIDEVNIIFNTSLGIFVIVGAVSVIVSLIVICSAHRFVKTASDVSLLRKTLAVMALDIAISFPLRTFVAILSAKLRYDLISCVSIGKIILRSMLIVYFIGCGYSVLALAVITICVNMGERLSIVAFAKKNFPELRVNLRLFDRNRLREFLNYSFHTFVAQLSDLIRFRMDVMVIAAFLGSVLVTHYNIALRLHEYSGQLIMSIISGTLPVLVAYYANKEYENLREKFMMLTRFHLLIAVAISGVVICVARQFISLWMGVGYLDAVVPLLILRFVSPLGIGQNASVQILYAMAKHKFYAYMSLLEAGANLTLSLLLVKPYGIVGVAVGTAVPFVLAKLFIMPSYVCRVVGISLSTYYFQLAKIIVTAGLAHFPFYLIMRIWSVESYASLLFMIAGYYAIYGFLLLRFLLPRNDRQYLADAVPHLKRIFV